MLPLALGVPGLSPDRPRPKAGPRTRQPDMNSLAAFDTLHSVDDQAYSKSFIMKGGGAVTGIMLILSFTPSEV